MIKHTNSQNVYQMYHSNACKFNFYVRKNSWGTWVAKVIGISGVTEGQRIPGRSPYYGDPTVTVEIYKVDFDIEDDIISHCTEKNFIRVMELSCPGTYQYYMI